MKIIYRISDGGNPKIKPEYVTKKSVFHHFYDIFKEHDIYVIADNITQDTYDFLQKYVDKSKITITNLGNSKSFLYSVMLAIDNFQDED